MLIHGSVKYSLPEPFVAAVDAVCSSLRKRGMRVVGQLDVSRRLEQSLGIGLAPCKILFVMPGFDAPHTDAIHPWAYVFLPLHVVISGGSSGAEILIQNTIRPGQDAVAAVYSPVAETQKQLADAVQAVAARASMLA